MDVSRLTLGEKIAAGSGLALFVFMFLPWFGYSVEGPEELGFSVSTSTNAWESFGFIDILLLLVVIVAVGITVMKALGSLPELPVPAGTAVLAAGALALVLILFRLLDTPGEEITGVGIEVSRKIGVFLGLVAAAGITYGGYTQTQEAGAGGASPRVGSGQPASTPPQGSTTPPPAGPSDPAGGGGPSQTPPPSAP